MTEAMDRDEAGAFRPDWASPPGDTVADLLDERHWTQQQLADRLGYSLKHVNQLIKGKVPLTEDAAIRLHSVLGASVGFWLTREAQYRERLAALEEAERHSAMLPWLDRLPLKDMMAAGALRKRRIDASSKPGLVAEALAFFGVASPEQWHSQYGCMPVAFRRTRETQADMGAISAWLRMGERIAERLDGPRYDEAVFRQVLVQIRGLTRQPPDDLGRQLQVALQAAGVAFVVVPALPRAHVSGVARWLQPHRPLIQLSLYGKLNDRYWFSLFHEAGHILLHGGQKKSVFLEDPRATDAGSPEEAQADAWARDFLVPPEHAALLPSLPHTRAAVQAYAERVGVHPGIVVGRLQHDGLLEPHWLNDLKHRMAL